VFRLDRLAKNHALAMILCLLRNLLRKVGETRARLVGPAGMGLGVWGVPTRGALNEGASRSDSSLAGFLGFGGGGGGGQVYCATHIKFQ
jgi:hypothetical protein